MPYQTVKIKGLTPPLMRLTACLPLLFSAQLLASSSLTDCISLDKNSDRLACYDKLGQSLVDDTETLTNTVLDERIRMEAINHDNSFSLIAHNSTYILPLSYTSNPNSAPFDALSTTGDADLDKLEVKFQISFRVPINRDFFVRNSHLWFAYTQVSLWQLYDSSNSAPFRETNYEPEIIWSFFTNYSLGELKLTHVNFALNHQSNGRSEPLSRSWNRLYLETIWAHKKWAFSFRPWYRIPERKDDDDNPDIDDYLGHFDFRAAYKEDDHTFSTVIRTALDEDSSHNFIELGYSFSINRKFRGYIQYVNGYGETLIDYNHRNKRFSIGIMLNDWF